MLKEVLLKYFKFYNTFFLFVISLSTMLFYPYETGLLLRLGLLVLVSVACEFVLINLNKNDSETNIQNTAFSFIIFLISDPQGNLFLPLFAVILAQLSYHLLKSDNKPAFNSPGLSVFILSLFGLKVSWWGIHNGYFVMFLMVLFGLIKIYIEKTYRLQALFFISIISLSFIFTFNPLFSIKQLFVPGFLFFGLYMLTQNLPEALPNMRKNIFYVVAVAIFALIIPKFGFFTDPLISSIVLADLTLFSIKYFKRSKY